MVFGDVGFVRCELVGLDWVYYLVIGVWCQLTLCVSGFYGCVVGFVVSGYAYLEYR